MPACACSAVFLADQRLNQTITIIVTQIRTIAAKLVTHSTIIMVEESSSSSTSV